MQPRLSKAHAARWCWPAVRPRLDNPRSRPARFHTALSWPSAAPTTAVSLFTAFDGRGTIHFAALANVAPAALHEFWPARPRRRGAPELTSQSQRLSCSLFAARPIRRAGKRWRPQPFLGLCVRQPISLFSPSLARSRLRHGRALLTHPQKHEPRRVRLPSPSARSRPLDASPSTRCAATTARHAVSKWTSKSATFLAAMPPVRDCGRCTLAAWLDASSFQVHGLA